MKTEMFQKAIVLSAVVALAAVLLAIASSKGPDNANFVDDNQITTSSVSASREQQIISRRPAQRRSESGAQSSGRLEATASYLQSLGTTLTSGVRESLLIEIDIRFADFFAELGGSPERIGLIRQHLFTAYSDILVFGQALQQGTITLAEGEARRDPNYVINQLSTTLSPEEVSALETYLEDEARSRFQSTYVPQLELVSAELSDENREILIETLFAQTYLRVNRNGLGMAANLETSFQAQLDAIANTRDSLRASMPPAQFEQADAFLREQEQGLLGAQTIFSPQ